MERDIVKAREYALKRFREGWTRYKIANFMNIPLSTIYSWIDKYQKGNISDLSNKITRIKMPIDTTTRNFVIKIRNKWNWGPTRIEKHIRLTKPKGISPIGHNKIYEILVEEGLNLPLDFVRKTWGTKRFERSHSNILWQTDFKLLDNDNWTCTFLDDHSRFVVGGKEVDASPTTDLALEIFEKAGKKFGFPEQVLTDQGVQFYAAPAIGKTQGVSRFTKTLKELGIIHIVASKRRPTTTGKIESFHRYLQHEAPRLNMDYYRFIRYWNTERPHQALKYNYPKDIYFRDFK